MPKEELNLPAKMQDFLEVLKRVSPSVSKNDLEKYEKWMQEFGSTWKSIALISTIIPLYIYIKFFSTRYCISFLFTIFILLIIIIIFITHLT